MFRPPGFWNMPRFKEKVQQEDGSYKRKWDGYIRLAKCPARGRHKFPAGLLQKVTTSLKEYGWAAKATGWPDAVAPQDVSLEGIEFGAGKWGHQREALHAALKAGRGILKIATGGGKTAIGTAIGKALRPPVLVCAYGRRLVIQWRREMAGFLGCKDPQVGLIGGGVWDEGDGEFVVASVPTLAMALDKKQSCEDHPKKALKGCEACRVIKENAEARYKLAHDLLTRTNVLISDEAHRDGADDHYEVAMTCTAPYRFGMSATPLDRTDGNVLRVIGATGEVFFTYGVDEGVEAEVILQPRIRIIPITQPILPANLDYEQAYQLGIVENTYRNQKITDEVEGFRSEELRSLVAVARIQHGEILAGMIPGSIFVSGEMSDKDMEAAFQAYRDGEVHCLISTVLAEGVNLPEIDAVILALGWKAPIPLLQRIGRGTRITGKLDYLPVRDFADMTCIVLLEQSLERVGVFKSTPGYVVDDVQQSFAL